MTFPIDVFSVIEISQVSDTRSGPQRLFRYKHEGFRSPFWMMNITTPPLDYQTGVGLSAYLDSLQGNLNTFDLPNPLPSIANNPASIIYATASVGATTLLVNTATDCRAGDFIQLNSGTKVYRIVSDSFGIGNKSITITPPLIQSVNSVPVAFNYGSDVVFRVSMEDRGEATIAASNGNFITHDVELIEQL